MSILQEAIPTSQETHYMQIGDEKNGIVLPISSPTFHVYYLLDPSMPKNWVIPQKIEEIVGRLLTNIEIQDTQFKGYLIVRVFYGSTTYGLKYAFVDGDGKESYIRTELTDIQIHSQTTKSFDLMAYVRKLFSSAT